jgi:ArsR family metal-binding transcriptional regulator
MEISFHGNVINLKEKLLEYEKRKTSVKNSDQIDSTEKNNNSQKVNSSFENIANIKKENLLAAGVKIKDEDEAYELLERLKSEFNDDFTSVLKTHNKINPDKVMRFYPFE